jgi:hypothetical protein
VQDAHAAVDAFTALPSEPGFVLHDIWLLRQQACSPKLAVTTPTTAPTGTATATWPKHLASMGISLRADAMP